MESGLVEPTDQDRSDRRRHAPCDTVALVGGSSGGIGCGRRSLRERATATEHQRRDGAVDDDDDHDGARNGRAGFRVGDAEHGERRLRIPELRVRLVELELGRLSPLAMASVRG
jgi:hypothetical protein